MPRLAVLLTACCVLVTRVASAGEVISETSVRQAISAFLQRPTSSASKYSMQTILKFAEESKDVSVFVSRKAAPWMGGEKAAHSEVLLCAFIAGNVRSQLDSGVNADDSYSGLVTVHTLSERP